MYVAPVGLRPMVNRMSIKIKITIIENKVGRSEGGGQVPRSVPRFVVDCDGRVALTGAWLAGGITESPRAGITETYYFEAATVLLPLRSANHANKLLIHSKQVSLKSQN